MGQYYDIINLDKEKTMVISKIEAAKLWDFYHHKEYDTALMNLMHTDWKGDKVIVLGDYADYAEEGTSIFELLSDLREKYELSASVQDWVWDIGENQGITEFDDIKKIEAEGNPENTLNLRYAYNHKLKQFIDVSLYPYKGSYVETPLILLLAVGNGYGNGDYEGSDKEYVGLWAKTSEYITIESEKLDLGYEEIIPKFINS